MRLFFKQPNKKRLILTLILIGLVLAVLLIPQIGRAVAAKESTDLVSTAIANVFGAIASLIVAVLGFFSILVIKMIIVVASYNSFIQAPAVNLGWTLVRDICNMFFILILLIIAFSTALGYEKFHYSKTLAPLLVAAVLINFSKLICGLLIDFSQIIMLAFVSSFAGAGGANFTNLVGFTSFFEGGALGAQSTGLAWQATIGYVMAVILTLIFLVVLLAMLAILVVRIVTLWFLVVLSPFVFFAQAVPTAQRYASQWWEEFGKQLMIGPVMAIFIWISLSVVSGGAGQLTKDFGGTGAGVATLKEGPNAFTAVTAPADFLHYVIGIGMMMGTLMVAQQFGGAGAKIGGAASKFLTKAAMAPGKAIGKAIKPYAQYAGGLAKGLAGVAVKAPFTLAGRAVDKWAKFMRPKREFPEPVEKKIQGARKWFKETGKRMQESEDRIAQGKGTIWDFVKHDIKKSYEKTGFKDREALSAYRAQTIEDTEGRLKTQMATPEHLAALARAGNSIEKAAAGLILLQRKYWKSENIETDVRSKNPKASDDEIKNLVKQEKSVRTEILKQTSAATKIVPQLDDRFSEAIHKEVDTKILVDAIYNGLKIEDKENQNKFAKAIIGKKIEMKDAIIKLDESQLKNISEILGPKGGFKMINSEDLPKIYSYFEEEVKKGNQQAIKKLNFLKSQEFQATVRDQFSPEEKKKYIAITGILERVFKNPDEMTTAFKNKVLKVGDIINVDYRQINDPTADALARTIKASGIKRLEENPDLAEKLIFAVQKGFEAGNEEMIKIAAGLENTEWKGYFKKQKEQQPPKIITP